MIEIIHKVHQQKLPAELTGEGRLHTKFKFAAAKRKASVAFVIIDDGVVVELGRADAERIVGIGRCEKEAMIPEEGANKLVVFGGRFAEGGSLREQVKPSRELRERAVPHQLLQVAI